MMLFAVLLSIQPTTLLAAGIAIDESRGCEISVQYTVQTGPAANVAFRLYRVARCNSDGSLTMDNAFKGYPVVIDTTDSERMTALAMTLEGYVAKDHIAAIDDGVTDSTGLVKFPVKATTLSPGVYLILGNSFVFGRTRYTPEPIVVQIPYTESSGEWGYSASVELKYTSEQIPDDKDDTINKKVLKVWRGDDEETRPDSIQVVLLKNGSVYDRVTLSEKNNWRHLWTSLDDSAKWLIVEDDVPEGYTVSTSVQGITCVITNTKEEKPPVPPITPVDPVNPPIPPVDPVDPPVNPENPPEENNEPKGDNTETIPQTGQLWWPVFLLAGVGIVMIGSGVLLRVKGKADEE